MLLEFLDAFFKFFINIFLSDANSEKLTIKHIV